MVNFGGFFAKLGHLAGFSLYIIYITGRISEVAMAVDIIFFSFGGPVEGYTGAQTMIFAGFICYFAIRNSEAAAGRAGGGVPVERLTEYALAARARVWREAFCFWK